MTRWEDRVAKKAALEQQWRRSFKSQPDSPDRQPPADSATLTNSPRDTAPSTTVEKAKPSPESDSTFTSSEYLMRGPSTKSCDSANAFQGTLPNEGPGDLKNDIHPIFRRSNCHGEAKQIYDILQPAFQLASRFLQSECLLPFWYTLFFSPCVKFKQPWHRCGRQGSYEFTGTPDELTPDQVR